jgi:tRNA 2-(methylsulfanyl)-N6-isopentenyladenosine37 hydroxylase
LEKKGHFYLGLTPLVGACLVGACLVGALTAPDRCGFIRFHFQEVRHFVHMIELRFATPNEWIATVLSDFDRFLVDHAAAEKKAAGMAMSMLSHYPDRPELVTAMADLAVEETNHFRDVVRIIQRRGIQLGPDEKDPYVNQLRRGLRSGSEEYLLDRLLVGGIIEARGCERFILIGEAVSDPSLKRFYNAIGHSESRHAQQFIDLAALYFPQKTVQARLDQLLQEEAAIVRQLPFRPALH